MRGREAMSKRVTDGPATAMGGKVEAVSTSADPALRRFRDRRERARPPAPRPRRLASRPPPPASPGSRPGLRCPSRWRGCWPWRPAKFPCALMVAREGGRLQRIAAAILRRGIALECLEVEDRAFLIGEAHIGAAEQRRDLCEAGIVRIEIVIGPDHVAAGGEGETVRHLRWQQAQRPPRLAANISPASMTAPHFIPGIMPGP